MTNLNQLSNGPGYTSNTGTVTSIATGTGLDGTFTTSGTITLDLSELTDMTGAIDASVDEIIMLDNGAERRKRFSEIFGSNAYNSTTIPTNNNQLTNGRGYITSYVNTTYSAGGGLDLSGTSFSLEPDLRGNASLIGYGNSDYIQFNQYTTDFRFSGNIEFQMQSDGDFHADGDIIAYSTSTASDAKLKTNIKTVEHALDKVCALDGVTFDWIKDGKESAGVIAQNVEEVLPRAVKEVKDLNSDDTHKSVEYNQLSALFIEAIKELREENKLLRAELENLKSINT